MKELFVHVGGDLYNIGDVMKVTTLEVLLSIDGMDGLEGVSYIPSRCAIAIRGQLQDVRVESLEQAIAWYAGQLHEAGRLRGKPLGYILPCIQVSYGTGTVEKLDRKEAIEMVKSGRLG